MNTISMSKELIIAAAAAGIVVLFLSHYIAYILGRTHEVKEQRKALTRKD